MIYKILLTKRKIIFAKKIYALKKFLVAKYLKDSVLNMLKKKYVNILKNFAQKAQKYV